MWKSRIHMRRCRRRSGGPVAAGALEVDGVAPRGAVAACEVRAELAGVVSDWPEVVVDDVENHGETAVMAGVDEAFERVGAAVVFGYGEQVDAVVAPAAIASERRNRHDFDVRDAKLVEVIEALDGRVEGACRGEGPDVHFVHDCAARGGACHRSIVPLESRVVIEA